MSREHLTSGPEREICPENSRYWMRWNSARNSFDIGKRGQKEKLVTLENDAYSMGRYVYATMRGQQRVEEMAKPAQPHARGTLNKDTFLGDLSGANVAFSEREMQQMWDMASAGQNVSRGGKDPAITHRHLYLGKDRFAHTEDASKRTGWDHVPRSANRKEDCFVAADNFRLEAGLRAVRTREISMTKFPTYQDLALQVRRHKLPFDLEIITQVYPVSRSEPAHEFIVLTEAGGEFICFEKAGKNLPWRLSTMREIYDMYEVDYRRANTRRVESGEESKVSVFWIGKDLEKETT